MKYINADQFERDCMFDKNCEDMQDVIYKLRDYPPADVVEVVRCKDCKHSIENVYSTSTNYKYVCDKTSAHSHIDYHSENWFCADGERRETE